MDLADSDKSPTVSELWGFINQDISLSAGYTIFKKIIISLLLSSLV
jgi:hypothetical protein